MTQEERLEKVGKTIRMLIQTDRFHQAAIEAQFNRYGIHRTQHMTLRYIMHCETPPTQREIAEAFEVSPATVAVTLKKLESAGLILRQPLDSRTKCIRITDAGRDILEKTRDLFRAVDDAMCADISDAELDALDRNLQKMQQNLKNFEPEIRKIPDCPGINGKGRKQP